MQWSVGSTSRNAYGIQHGVILHQRIASNGRPSFARATMQLLALGHCRWS
jgi:hypothetical protein